MTPETINAIKAHYEHAKRKHPFFAKEFVALSWMSVVFFGYDLEACRNTLRRKERNGGASATDILRCEVAEVLEAYASGRLADAKEECYDAVAVLLRMVDMIEAEQKEQGEK